MGTNTINYHEDIRKIEEQEAAGAKGNCAKCRNVSTRHPRHVCQRSRQGRKEQNPRACTRHDMDGHHRLCPDVCELLSTYANGKSTIAAALISEHNVADDSDLPFHPRAQQKAEKYMLFLCYRDTHSIGFCDVLLVLRAWCAAARGAVNDD